MINTKLLASTTSIRENVCEMLRWKIMLSSATSCCFLSKGGAAEDEIYFNMEK